MKNMRHVGRTLRSGCDSDRWDDEGGMWWRQAEGPQSRTVGAGKALMIAGQCDPMKVRGR